MLLPFSAEIYFYPTSVDFRKQMDGLIILISDALQMNPTSGQIFIFRNRKADKLKIIYWDNNGFWLLYRRLEKDKFKFPAPSDVSLQITTEQFQWLLSGLDISNYVTKKELKYSEFF